MTFYSTTNNVFYYLNDSDDQGCSMTHWHNRHSMVNSEYSAKKRATGEVVILICSRYYDNCARLQLGRRLRTTSSTGIQPKKKGPTLIGILLLLLLFVLLMFITRVHVLRQHQDTTIPIRLKTRQEMDPNDASLFGFCVSFYVFFLHIY